MRSRANIVLFLLFFILPLLAVIVYEVRFATDRYHSDASLTITEEHGASPSIDLSVIGLPAPGGSKDALVVLEFILSLDMLQYLDQNVDLRQHYSASNIDWLTRLPASASLEDFHVYMADYLTAAYDADSQLIRIQVQAFNREYANKLVNLILARSQEFIDKLNAKITTEQTQFFEKQLVDSEKRLRELKLQLLNFQREHRLLTTTAEATLVNANIGEIERLLLLKEGELSARSQELNESSPVMQVLRSDIQTLKMQLAKEKERLSGGNSGAVSELDAQFREIEFNLDFVGGIYKSNLTQLEQVRMDAVQRLKYLIIVTQPTIADASLYPDRIYVIGTAAMILLMVFFILSLLVAIIREHT